MLRSPTFGERGLMYNTEESGRRGALQLVLLRVRPFVNLPEGRVFTLHEFVQQSDRSNVDVYMKFSSRSTWSNHGPDLREHGCSTPASADAA